MSAHDDALAGATLVQALDPESLPPGKITRLLVEIVQGPFGLPISVPVLVAKGERPGPVFGLTAAVHGNEVNGIPVIHRLFEWLDPTKIRGVVAAAVVVNVPAFQRHQRRYLDGRDLNHLMPGRWNGNAAEVYAHRVMDRIIRHFDFLIDLHTASFGRVNSLYVRADTKVEAAARMAYLQRPQIILHDPPSDHTVRGAAGELGIPAITLEIGNPNRFQPEMIRRSLVGVRAVLAEAGIIKKRKVAPFPMPILCERSYWIYTDHGGLLEVYPGVTDQVAAGDEIGRLTNIFGDVLRELRAPEDGVVIGKSSSPVGHTGARILHLGVLAKRDGPISPPHGLDELLGGD